MAKEMATNQQSFSFTPKNRQKNVFCILPQLLEGQDWERYDTSQLLERIIYLGENNVMHLLALNNLNRLIKMYEYWHDRFFM